MTGADDFFSSSFTLENLSIISDSEKKELLSESIKKLIISCRGDFEQEIVEQELVKILQNFYYAVEDIED